MWPLTTADSLHLVVCPRGPSLERFLKSDRILKGKAWQAGGTQLLFQSAGKEEKYTLTKGSEGSALKRPMQFSAIGMEASHASIKLDSKSNLIKTD